MRQHIESLSGNEVRINGNAHEPLENLGPLFNRNNSGRTQNTQRSKSEEFVEDLEYTMPGVIPTISNQVSNHASLANGNLGGKQVQNRTVTKNGHVSNGRPNFRSMLEDAELDSHI